MSDQRDISAPKYSDRQESARTTPRRVRARESIALLIHGTFAASKSSHGEKWWQLGSSFSEVFRSLLPRGVRLNKADEVFHWSGENSERARSKAAKRLLDHLKELESAGKDYHLVGHSHGGSVIWHALKLATLKRQRLRGLRSWTTVGTPFLQHRGRPPLCPINVLSLALALFLIIPYAGSVRTFFGMFRDCVDGATTTFVARPDHELGFAAILRAPVLALGEALGVRVERRSDGIHLGSFDPEGDLSFAEYLFLTREGVTLVFLAALHLYIGLQLIVWFIAPLIESRRIRAEGRLEKHAYHRFGSRWLGIWSEDDEAINGLRSTLDLSMQFVSKMTPHERVFVSDMPTMISGPLFLVFSTLYNKVIQPYIDRYVRRMVSRSAQGNDRPTAELIKVTPTPLREVCHDFAELPPGFNKRLVKYADRYASELAPKLRRWLAQPSFAAGIEALADDLSGKELIHTSYFDHDEIAGLICCNISLGTPGLSMPQSDVQLTPELLDWFEFTKRELSRNCGPDPIRMLPRARRMAA